MNKTHYDEPFVVKKPREAMRRPIGVRLYLNHQALNKMDYIRDVYLATFDRPVSQSLIVRRALDGLAARLRSLVDKRTGALRSGKTTEEELTTLLRLKA